MTEDDRVYPGVPGGKMLTMADMADENIKLVGTIETDEELKQNEYIIYEVTVGKYVIVRVNRNTYITEHNWINALRWTEEVADVSGKAYQDKEARKIIQENREDILKRLSRLEPIPQRLLDWQNDLLNRAKDYNYKVAY